MRLIIFLSCVIICTLSAKSQEVNYQLPKNVKPIRYHLKMIPDFVTDRFSGSVSIEILALQDSNYITLHANLLSIPLNGIVVKELETNKTLTVKSAGVSNTVYQYFTINLNEELIQDRLYVLTISNFNAKFNKYSSGFASGTFKDSNGTTRYYAYTQFQPVDARRAFPCFDEPALRAKFNVRLVRPNQNYISASNGQLISQSNTAPYEDVFEETVDMPTYLVAFTISEMKFSETLDRYRIIARSEAINQNQHKYALNLTVPMINFMETYTRVPFVLPKLDQVGIPTYSGGMENWGLIVYGESSLLLIQENYKPGIASLVAHEIAHQWFGNHVGLTWWEYLWLNEGFATYFQLMLPSLFEPIIDGRGAYLHSMQTLFQVDMRLDTRPLSKHPKTPIEIWFLFDSISYKKGAAVIRMLETVLTQPVFQKGVQYYVEEMLFDQATPTVLYNNLQKALNESVSTSSQPFTVADFMYAWETADGFPVVNVTRIYENSDNNVELKQTRYISSPQSTDGHWIIPVNFISNGQTKFATDLIWMTETKQTISVPYLNNDWIIANVNSTLYYRVNYDRKNWDLITQTLMTNHENIPVLNRAQLIDDSMNFVKTNRLDAIITRELLKYMTYERDPIPWKSYYMNDRKLGTMFYYSQNYNIFREYNFNITKSAYSYVGFEEKTHESVLQKDLRLIILNMLCKLDHPECLNKSLHKFRYWRNINQDVSKLESVVLCGAIRAGNQQDFNYLFNVLKKANYLSRNAIEGLICSKQINNLNKLLEASFSNHLNIQIDRLLNIVADVGPTGLQAAVDFIATNYETLENTLEEKTVLVLENVGELISNRYQLNKLKRAVNNSKYRKLFKNVFTASEANIEWRSKHANTIVEKLLTTN